MDSRILSLRDRGNDLMSNGDYDRAIAVFTEAIQIDPAYPALYSDRGEAYYKKGDISHAISDFQRAYDGMPENNYYRTQLWEARQAAGKNDCEEEDDDDDNDFDDDDDFDDDSDDDDY